jgi:RNA polymerase sigma-70 factor, ECF subfamily
MSLASDDALHALAPRIRAGDARAFEVLFRALHAPLCEVVDSYVRSQMVAEEIVQDLFLVVWIKRERWDLTRSPRAYLFEAARHRALHHLRHRAVVRRWSERAAVEQELAALGTKPVAADRGLESDQTRDAVRAAIDQLPPRARLALVLQHDHEMSHAEIATAMGISNKGVEKLLAVARSRLRMLLQSVR